MTQEYDNLTEQYGAKPTGYYEMDRSEMLGFVPSGARSLLEVGCGSGAFGHLIKKTLADCEVWGIEPDPSAAAVAQGRLDNVINGTFPAGADAIQGKRFDVICFNDVLEHLANPEKALMATKEFLTDGGVVVASIPNILYFYQILEIVLEQDWRYQVAGILDNTHLRFFTKKSIVRLFESSGFEIDEIKGINSCYGIKYRVANLITLGRLIDWKYIQFGVRARPAL